MEDPFRDVSVHGIWPLVGDPEAPAGIRFAVPGQDAVEACITDPGDLPDFGVVLRTFGNASECAAWVSGVTDVGSNAVGIVLPPDNWHLPFHPALLVRHDRTRPVGARTMEEAIGFLDGSRGDATEPRLSVARSAASDARQRAFSHLEDRRRRNAHSEAWAVEIAILRSMPRMSIEDLYRSEPGDDLRFRQQEPKTSFTLFNGRLRRIDGVPHFVGMQADAELTESDLAGEWTEAYRSRGFVVDDDDLVLPVPDLGTEAWNAYEAAERKLHAVRSRLSARAAARVVLDGILADAETMKMLRRMAEGAPVIASSGGPGRQAGIRTGYGQNVAGTRIEAAFKAGLIEAVWWDVPAWAKDVTYHDDGFGPVPSRYDMRDIIHGLTASGRLLLAGDRNAAAEASLDDAASNLAWTGCKTDKGTARPRRPHAGLRAVADTCAKPSGVLLKALRDNCAIPTTRTPVSKLEYGTGLVEVAAMLACGLLVAEPGEGWGTVSPSAQAAREIA